MKQYGKVAYSVKIRNREQHHLLISRGCESSPFFYNKPDVFGSWLYTFQTNSWQKVDSDKFPPLSGNPLMVQICSKVLVFGALGTNGKLNSSKAWLFHTVSLNWQQTDVTGDIPNWLSIASKGDYVNVGAVSPQQPKSKCKCDKSSIAVSELLPHRKLTTHEVRCINHRNTELKMD